MNFFNGKIKPMLAYSLPEPFDSEEYFFELKFDGTRCIAFIRDKKVKLQNRRLLDITRRYPELHTIYKNLDAREAILDGEIVVLSEGVPDFNKLQYREHAEDEFKVKLLSDLIPAFYIVFDILFLNGSKLTEKTLEERKMLIENNLVEGERIIISSYVKKYGKKLFKEAINKGFEGIMAKHIESKYIIGERSKYWLKIKKKRTLDCIICGYTEGEGLRKDYFGSLILGCYRKGKLSHVGQVGTGFDEGLLRILKKKLDAISTPEPPFSKIPKIGRKVKWVLPTLVCEVEFLEFTKDGKLRSPIFRRLRSDKSPEECEIPDPLNTHF